MAEMFATRFAVDAKTYGWLLCTNEEVYSYVQEYLGITNIDTKQSRFALAQVVAKAPPAERPALRREIARFFATTDKTPPFDGVIDQSQEFVAMYWIFSLVDVARVRRFLQASSDPKTWAGATDATAQAWMRLAPRHNVGDERCKDERPAGVDGTRQSLRNQLAPVDLTPLIGNVTLLERWVPVTISQYHDNTPRPISFLVQLLELLDQGVFPVKERDQIDDLAIAILKHSPQSMAIYEMRILLTLAENGHERLRNFLYGNDPKTGTVHPVLGKYFRSNLTGCLRGRLLEFAARQGHPEVLAMVYEILQPYDKEPTDRAGRKSPLNPVLFHEHSVEPLGSLLVLLLGAKGIAKEFEAIATQYNDIGWIDASANASESASSLEKRETQALHMVTVQRTKFALACEHIANPAFLPSTIHPDRASDFRSFSALFVPRIEQIFFTDQDFYAAFLGVVTLCDNDGVFAVKAMDAQRKARLGEDYRPPQFSHLTSLPHLQQFNALRRSEFHLPWVDRIHVPVDRAVHALFRLTYYGEYYHLLDALAVVAAAQLPTLSYYILYEFSSEMPDRGPAAQHADPYWEGYYRALHPKVDHVLPSALYANILRPLIGDGLFSDETDLDIHRGTKSFTEGIEAFLVELYPGPEYPARNLYQALPAILDLKNTTLSEVVAHTYGQLDADDRYPHGPSPTPLRGLGTMVERRDVAQEKAWVYLTKNADSTARIDPTKPRPYDAEKSTTYKKYNDSDKPPLPPLRDRIPEYVQEFARLSQVIHNHTLDSAEILLRWQEPSANYPQDDHKFMIREALRRLTLTAIDQSFATEPTRVIHLYGELLLLGHPAVLDPLLQHFGERPKEITPHLERYLKNDRALDHGKVIIAAVDVIRAHASTDPVYWSAYQLLQTATQYHRPGAWQAVGDLALDEIHAPAPAGIAIDQLLADDGMTAEGDPRTLPEALWDERDGARAELDTEMAARINTMTLDDLATNTWVADYAIRLDALGYPESYLALQRLQAQADELDQGLEVIHELETLETLRRRPLPTEANPLIEEIRRLTDIAINERLSVSERVAAVDQLGLLPAPEHTAPALAEIVYHHLVPVMFFTASAMATFERSLQVLIFQATAQPPSIAARIAVEGIIQTARNELVYGNRPDRRIFLDLLLLMIEWSDGQLTTALNTVEEVAGHSNDQLHEIARMLLCQSVCDIARLRLLRLDWGCAAPCDQP